MSGWFVETYVMKQVDLLLSPGSFIQLLLGSQ